VSNDTNHRIKSQFYRLMTAKSPLERLKMGCSMFDAAKGIVKSAIREKCPEISPGGMKEEVFLRFYGMEFSQKEKEKILRELYNYGRVKKGGM